MRARASRCSMQHRGFTLLELMIAGAIAACVMLAGAALMVNAAASARRTRAAASMRRGASLVLEQLGSELRQAGLGRPHGRRKSSASDLFPGPILSATTTSITFVADVPRPTSSFNGFSHLNDELTAASGRAPDALPLLNELNNGCDVRASTLSQAACDTAASSLVLSAATGNCYADPDNAPSCPWALGKYQPSEFLIVQDGDGTWDEVQVTSATPIHTGPLSSVPPGVTRLMLKLTGGIALTRASGGFVASPDRLFYGLAGTSLTRRQCWASIGAPGAVDLINGCVTGFQTTDEPLASDVQSLSLDYFDAAGTSLLSGGSVPAAALGRIRRVHVHLVMQEPNVPAAAPQTYDLNVALREG